MNPHRIRTDVTDQDRKNRVVRKLLRKRAVGSHKKQIDTVVNWFPSHAQGRTRTLIQEMMANPSCPVEGYGGGNRQNMRLSSVDAAVAYLKEHGGDVPFGFD